MARAFTIFVTCLCLLFSKSALAQKSVFALAAGEQGLFSLQEWDCTTLEPIKVWPLDKQFVKYWDQEVFLDRRSNKAVIRFHSKGDKLLIFDLKTASQKVVPDISPFRPITYRFENGFLEALQPNPNFKEVSSHWKVWRLIGEQWQERIELRTTSIESVVPGFRWHQIADEALKRTIPLDRIDSFGVCGNGGGRLMHEQIFGYSGASGSLDVESGRALIHLDMFGEDSEYAIYDAKKGGLTFVKADESFFPFHMQLVGERIVMTRGDGWAATADSKGRISKKRKILASLVLRIG